MIHIAEAVRDTLWPPRLGLRARIFTFKNLLKFWKDYHEYTRLTKSGPLPEYKHIYPCLGDNTGETAIEISYYYQDAWAFEKIVTKHPPCHLDVGSHHKFVSLLSKVVPTTMVDLRPLPVKLDTLKFKEGTIVNMPYENESMPSVSSLCVVEHIGLGRYGDPIDPLGTERAVNELKRIVQPGGDLYISVPLDDANRIYFNAHRAFTEEYLNQLFAPFDICERRYIFGNCYGDKLQPGFGTGCYHLRRPL
ncbi:MAG TPA: DUF268 domain-containing protein [Chryseolinea sp.]